MEISVVQQPRKVRSFSEDGKKNPVQSKGQSKMQNEEQDTGIQWMKMFVGRNNAAQLLKINTEQRQM